MKFGKILNGYEGYYQISNLGRVKGVERTVLYRGNNTRRINEKIMKTHINSHGYEVVYFCKDNINKCKKIHRLVAEAFINNNNKKPCVNHIDGNKQNNNMKNLEWVTYTENMLHAYSHNLCEKTRESASKRLKERHLEMNGVRNEMYIPNEKN